LRPIPKRFSDVIDRLPTNSWVALTPDRKLVAGLGATEQEAAGNAMSDYGLHNPLLIKVPEPANRKSITRVATEQTPAQLLREGKVVYDVTLDLIVQESGVDDLPASVTRNIVRMDLAQGTAVENGYYGLRFTFDGKQMEDTVYVKGTALMHRMSS